MSPSLRIQAIASLVAQNAIIADIGSDHGLLLTYLLKHKKIVKGYASDNKRGPYNRLLKQFSKEPRVGVYLADGLDKLASDVDCLIITGMGASLIESIIRQGVPQLANINSLIISPHNEPQLIRGLMSELGYYVVDELIVYDKGQYYDVIKFMVGQATYNRLELIWGPLNLKRRSPLLLDKMRQRKLEIKRILPKVTLDKHNQLLNELKELDDYDQNT